LKQDERQPSKKKPNIYSNSISFFSFATKEPFKKDDVPKKKIWEDLGLLIVKTHQVLYSLWKIIGCKGLVCIFVQELFFLLENNYKLLSKLVEKIKQLHGLPRLT
jgi:hypothetical protein